jgi:hypothetical protein
VIRDPPIPAAWWIINRSSSAVVICDAPRGVNLLRGD